MQHEAHPDARAVLASLGHAVIVTSPDGYVVAWNPAAERLYGWTDSETIGRHVTTLHVPDMPVATEGDIAQALRNRLSWAGGLLVRRHDGARFVALLTAAGIYQGDALVAAVFSSVNLGEAARPLMERSTEAALMLRPDAIVAYASPAVRQLFGWDDEALLGKSIVPFIHEGDRLQLAGFLERVVTTAGPHPAVEMRVKADTGWIWAQASLTDLLDDPTVRGVVFNLRPSIHRTAHEAADARAEQLQTALNSRVIIERAKGYLAALNGRTPEEAFAMIRGYARGHHLSVHEVCRGVLAGEVRP